MGLIRTIQPKSMFLHKPKGSNTANGEELKSLDVAKDSVDALAGSLTGVDALIIATGFVPGNPFAMNAEAHAVDNLGTKALVDAAKKSGVKKIVLVPPGRRKG